jgi:hypothetical protein
MRRVPLLLLTFLALPAFAAVPVDGEIARLVSPAAGEELAAGSVAMIEWEGLALPEHAEEWEAFLSLDGGRTWPVRVTPHLDVTIRRFAFRVPDLPSREARILLRFGDERREVGMETPQRFAIAPAAFLVRSLPPRSRVHVLSRGEHAKDGDAGVVVWVEGSRSGEGLREVVVWEPDSGMQRVRPAGLLVLLLGAPVSARVSLAPPAVSPDPAPRTAFRVPEKRAPRPPAVPVRLLIRRFNE